MDAESLGGGAAGAATVVLAGWLGKALVTYTRGRIERRKLTTERQLSSNEHARAEANELLKYSYTKTQERIEDLEGALDRLANSERRLQNDVDRLRAEREAAKEAALEQRLRARDLDQKLTACRRLHEDLKHELERQQAVIERLQGD